MFVDIQLDFGIDYMLRNLMVLEVLWGICFKNDIETK